MKGGKRGFGVFSSGCNLFLQHHGTHTYTCWVWFLDRFMSYLGLVSLLDGLWNWEHTWEIYLGGKLMFDIYPSVACCRCGNIM